MFLINMTPQEVAMNYERDNEWFNKFVRSYYNGHRHTWMKVTRFPFYHWCLRPSPDYGNAYLICLNFSCKKDVREGNVIINRVGLVRDGDARYHAFHRLPGDNVILYKPHFFDRFTERKEQGTITCTEQRLSKMALYFACNFVSLPNFNPVIYDGKVAYEHTVNLGMELLSRREDGMYVAQTYITEDMLYERQRYEDSQRRPGTQLATYMFGMSADRLYRIKQAMKASERPQQKQMGNLKITMPRTQYEKDRMLTDAAFDDINNLKNKNK